MRAPVLIALVSAGCGGVPTLSQLQKDTFSPSCAFATCHQAGTPQNGLDFGSPDLHARIVNVNATIAGKKYVVPGDPANSYIIQKLTLPMPASGTQMPPGAPIDPADVERIKSWIAAGAKND